MNRIARHSEQTPARPAWWAVIAVGLATFSVVTTEMLPVGLLTPIAHSLDAPIGNAGLLVSLPALLAALSAPALVMAAGSIDRRRILCGLLGLLVVANIASALAPGMTTMLAARTLVGFCMGGIWAIAGGLALRLVPGRSVGLATALIFGGVAAASVLGVPLGALIGESAGWRWAFGAMAIFSALTLLLHLVLVPPLPAAASTRAQQFGAQLRNNHVQIGLLLTLLLVSAHFMAFTYVRPLLVWVSGLPSHWFGALLFAYGGMGIIGNFLAGLVAARHPRATVATISSGLLLTPLLLLALGATAGGGASVLLLWGLAYGGVSVGLMSWMMRAAPRATEVATALYTSTFNAGIAIGAWAGGQVVDGWGLTANLWLPALLAAIALLLALRVRMPQAVWPAPPPRVSGRVTVAGRARRHFD